MNTAYLALTTTVGDLVHVRGRLRQSSYERNGSRYTVDLVASSSGLPPTGHDCTFATDLRGYRSHRR